MLYVFCVECFDKKPINKRYNANSVVATHGKGPRVAFVFARQPQVIKRITPMVLYHEGIYIAKFIHLNNGATPTALRDETIVWVIWLIIKCEMICVISSRKMRQNTRSFDAF